ncbi:MAG: phosphoribosylanthranilate isomerase [Litorimonas sp.]
MTTRAKICGLTRPQDVAYAIEYGASFLGFIVEAKSPRKLSVAQAAAIAAPAINVIPRVAVTVNADDVLLSRIMADMAPDYIQLHGDETPQRAAQIARKFTVKTIKASPIATDQDVKTASEYSGAVDLILFDAKPPAGSDVRGGHGITIDWDIIASAPTPKTFILAGGLTPQTVGAAIAATRAPIVDVSSGVEASAGVKDASKIKAFMDAVKQG